MGKKFVISITVDEDLDIEQLWPDGDAPENPTAEDVLLLIEDCGGLDIIKEWNLRADIQVFDWVAPPRKFS